MRGARRPFVPILAVLAAASAASAEPGAVAGRVSAAVGPLAAARVYAYQLADARLEQASTDAAGGFRFEGLPAGLYKVIAFKPGFVPAVALLTRASAQAAQYLEMDLEPAAPERGSADFWAVRRQIPPDVLRDIEMTEAVAAWSGEPMTSPPALLRAEMRAVAGVDRTLAESASQLTGGRVDVEGAFREMRIGVSGDYLALQPAAAADSAAGHSQTVSIDLDDGGANQVQVSSFDNTLASEALGPGVNFESHGVSWSRSGEQGVARVSAQYVAESNYYRRSALGTLWLPEESRSFRLEGSYSRPVGDRSHIEAGVRYRDREAELAGARFGLPEERVEAFGRAGLRLRPALLVEYGVYSTMRDGRLSLMPQGSFVLRLGPDWQARTTASAKLHEDPRGDSLLQDFAISHFSDYAGCDHAAEHCYQVVLSRDGEGDEERFSFGALHRQFDETLRLQFDRSFFNQHENLYLVPGDAVPELQLALQRRLAPGILTRLQTNFGAGGGGVVWAGPRPKPFENDVRYFVTSLDTRFQATATGVFVAFHYLEQRLEPLRLTTAERLLELERLQVLVTQELDFLHELASDFAVQLNMEVSRGLLPGLPAGDPDELRSRVTGGFAVSF